MGEGPGTHSENSQSGTPRPLDEGARGAHQEKAYPHYRAAGGNLIRDGGVAGARDGNGGALRRDGAVPGDEGRRARPRQHPRRTLPGYDGSSPGRPTAGMTFFSPTPRCLMFEACLDDANVGVRDTALKAACSYLPGPSAVAASSLVPKMISVLEASFATVKSVGEGVAGDVLEALNVVAANQPLMLIGDPRSLDVVGSDMLSLAGSPTLKDSTRELSLEVITGLCESAPPVFREGGGGIVGAVVPLTMNMVARHPEGDESEEELVAWLSTAGGSEDDMNGHLDGDGLCNIFANALHRSV
ncbi:unnamed protein product, partial [Ectocarpus sp. 4 AP-2014]